jgi:hypothetical protein
MTDEPIHFLRARLSHVLAIRASVAWVTFWCFAWGTAVLVLRFAGVERAPIALTAGLAGLACVVVAAAVRSRRELPAELSLRALVDRDSHAGGLLLAAAETDASAWASSIPRTVPHRIRWRGGRPLSLLLLSGIFVWAAFLVPARFVRPTPRLDVGPEAARLEEQLGVLKDEEIIDLEQATLLEEQLDDLVKNADAGDPSKTWESLDSIAEAVDKAAAEAAEDAIRDTEQLASLETLAEGLGDASASISPADLAEAMKDLGVKTAEVAAANARFAAAIDPELAATLASGSATAAQLEALAKAAGMTREQLRETLQKMSQAGLADQKTMQRAEAAGRKGSSKELSDYLKENPGQGLSPGAMAAAGSANGDGDGPGAGGVSRGPGHGALQFTGQTADADRAFRELVLPESAIDSEAVSIPIASSPGLPDEPGADAAAGGGGTTGALAGAASGGGSAARQQIRPRHRDAVSRYFERKNP